jgi:phytoene dehydrogenase-like protein
MAFDVVVIGAGHNGLVCAGLLAKAGRRVLVVERREIVGGLCAGEEFHPGYRHTGLLLDTTGLRPWIVEALDLKRHGLAFEAKWPKVFSPAEHVSQCVSCGPDGGSELEPPVAAQWAALLDFVRRVRPAVLPLVNTPPIDVPHARTREAFDLLRHGWAARRLGRRDMMELLRVPPMSVADWLREWLPSEPLCAVWALPAVSGTWMGPRSPGSAANLLLHLCTMQRPVAGGAESLVQALSAAARAHRVEIRTHSRVQSVLVRNGAVTGVQFEGGEEIAAAVVVATCDPRQLFLDLIAKPHLSDKLESRISRYRMRGTTARVNLALQGDVAWRSGHGARAHYVRTASHMDDIERAFDAVKYRRFAERPVLDIHIPTRARPELAPEGCHVMCIHAHFAPHRLEGGWSDPQRQNLGEAVITELERHAPGIRDLVVGREVLSPADIEARYGVTGGHIHHGEHALDQLLTRPIPEAARYATPLRGLFLGGSGSHPGGGITGAPGALAAQTVLDDTSR